MAANSRSSAESPPPQTGSGLVAGVRLEISSGASRPAFHDVSSSAFLIGSVPGCDLRLGGADLPPVICIVTRHAGGAEIRRLAPPHPGVGNGPTVTSPPPAEGGQGTPNCIQFLVDT